MKKETKNFLKVAGCAIGLAAAITLPALCFNNFVDVHRGDGYRYPASVVTGVSSGFKLEELQRDEDDYNLCAEVTKVLYGA